MLKKISLTNFKSFKEMNDLELKNLTVIVGKNSCGKSSILQSLLLLKQTLDSSSNKPLCLEGKYLKFSNLKEISFGLPPINQAKIGYKFLFESENISGNIDISFRNKRAGNTYELAIDTHDVNIYGEENDGSLKYNELTTSKIKKIIADRVGIAKDFGEIVDYKILYHRFLPDAIDIGFRDDNENRNNVKLPIFILSDTSQKLYSELNNALKNIHYLSPVRAIPERAYVHYSQDVSELNEDGSNAAHILWSKQNEIVLWKGKEIKLREAVNECINCMGLSQQISPDRVGEILYKVGIHEKVSGKNVSLADVGFGYSQILPVILMGLINNKNSLMLLEQPEIHLHPSSAANLADLFLNFIKGEKRFVIETHSPEFINRLRLRVIQDPSIKDKINIVFVESNDDLGSSIKQFSIDENGMFPEWPNGFLDESEKNAQAILEARLNRGEK